MADIERELAELKARVSTSIFPSPAMREGALRRSRTRRIVTATSAVAVAVALAIGFATSIAALGRSTHRPPVAPGPSPTSDTPSLGFERAPGWYVRTTDAATAQDFGPQAWAANVPFQESADPTSNPEPQAWPTKTEQTLPSDGILVVAEYAIQTRNPLPPLEEAPQKSLPLAIEHDPVPGGEGGDPHHASTAINATVNGRWVNVRVVFGTRDPGTALLREANEEVARLIVAAPAVATDEINDFGIRIDLPSSWHGILFCCDGNRTLLAETTPITELYFTQRTRDEMGKDDVFLELSENSEWLSYEPVTLPIAIGPEDACPTCEVMDNGTSPPPDHALFYRSFAVSGRTFDLYAEFGTASPSSAQLARVNEILATLQIQPPDNPPAEKTSEPPAKGGSITVTLPSNWIEKDDPVPTASPARVVGAYGTWDFPTGGECGPEPALRDLPSDGALVWAVEHSHPGNAGDYIDLSPQFSIDLQTPPARWACAASAPSRQYLFRVGGRYLEVHVSLGRDASGETLRQADALIDSIRP